jgi:hypothetical protein
MSSGCEWRKGPPNMEGSCKYNFPIVLYGCEIWSLELTEEHRFRMWRRIFGPKRDEILAWRKLHNEEPHKLYSLPNIIKMIVARRIR